MSISACNLSIVPLRAEASHRSEMVSQVLFGENFELLEEGVDFARIRLSETKYEGWIQNHQYATVVLSGVKRNNIVDISGAKAISGSKIVHLLHGTVVSGSTITIGEEHYSIEGTLRDTTIADFKTELPKLIQFYKNSPYMWGGRSVFGIDCSGLSQVFYKHFGISLMRDAYQQAEGGKTVDFLTEIQPGDLAFFDNEAGRIVHVGVMIDSETIIHASGRVRIDKMDSQGIFNTEQNRYTHNLRIVKRYF
ncbi:C40 family peptidase [Sphingobacterium bovistauri]|uniref:C40 family peptidase n=1 Tax=Sphingobacterium bovistauri TaxID=2781959 RepID=A0ABS7Z3X8_9SPHI|nr:C40 family peptidase [Sphingobacterium bovistauri]MCA5004883.1 C40 family peptidase [Sphingobacterium bovistauri]